MQRIGDRFRRPLDVGLEHDVEGLHLVLAHLVEDVLQLRGLLPGDSLLPGSGLAQGGDFARLAFVRNHHRLVARLGGA